MTKAELKAKCAEQIKFMQNKDNFMYTAIVPLATVGDNRWAIVFGYAGGFDVRDADVVDEDEGYCLCGKVAFQSVNAIMSEYDIDWLLPWHEDGDCYDDIFVGSVDDADYLIDLWFNEIEKIAEDFIGKY